MKRLCALVVAIFMLFCQYSCCSEKYTIMSVNEDGMNIDHKNGNIRVGFLKEASPAEQDTSEDTEEVIINVRDYGAVGDGVTNDSKACHNHRHQ